MEYRPLTGVSKQWRDFLQSIPSLWTRLEFTGRPRSVSPTAFRKYILFSQNKVTDLVINSYQRNLGSSLRSLVGDLPRLRHLRLERPQELQTILLAQNLQSLVLSVSFTIPLSWVESILCKCSTLQSVEFHSVRQPVKSLTFPSVLPLRSLYMTFGVGNRTMGGVVADIVRGFIAVL